ncbi:sensor histidine kinase [Undibacterium sp. Ji50W]|uniref:sensor histidine kinase n=1 Tax=Undibacterium sp. Ji50W TaxID=3413041 RepID=UPI003BF2C003
MKRLVTQPGLIGLGLIALGAETMIGWVTRQPLWVLLFPSSTVMVFSTAFCFFCAGIAFVLPMFRAAHTALIRNLAGITIVLIGGVMLLENVLSIGTGLDMPDLHRWFDDANPYPGRMAPNTALAFMAGGVGLLYREGFLYLKPRMLAAIMLTISLLGMVGYALLLDLAYTWYGFPRMAFSTGLGMSLFACTLLLERAKADGAAKKESNIYLFLGVAITVLISTMFVSYGSLRALDARTNWVDHTYQVRLFADEVISTLQQARRAGDQHEFKAITAAMDDKLLELQRLSKDNPTQQNRLTQLRQVLQKHLDAAQRILPEESSDANGSRLDVEFKPLILMMNQFANAESLLLVQRKQDSIQSTSSTISIIVIGNLLGFAILLFTFWLLKNQNDQRNVLELALQQSNTELESKVEERTRAQALLNDELQELNQTLEARIAERTADLESFTYSISHDLRAPLRAIDGFGRMLEEDYAATLDKSAARYLAVIRSNSQRMGNLIDDLLAFSRLGRQDVVKFQIDMAVLVQEVINDAVQNLPDPPEIQVQALPSAFADRSLMKQAWVNLVSNAIKYSRKKEQPRIEISGSAEDGVLRYMIMDNGAGFNMEYYDKLFGVFQRLHHVDEFSGTGVGLAIVHRIVSRHGGRIWAESVVDEGATFFFTLPMGEHNG